MWNLGKTAAQTATLFFAFVAPLKANANSAIRLEEYLSNVRSANSAFQAASNRRQGHLASKSEAALFFFPRLQGSAQTMRDSSYPGQPGFNYNRIRTEAFSLGIIQDFDFGLAAKLSVESQQIRFINAQFGGTPINFQNWNAVPKAELRFSLWQNFLGRGVRAQRDSLLFQNDMEAISASAKEIEILVNAETTYWRLVTAREIVRIQQEAFARSEALLQFIERKAKLDLREKSDVLQTRASHIASQLALKNAKDEERAAVREFNRWRGADANVPVGKLEELETTRIESLSLPEQMPGSRIDTELARAQLALAKAAAIASEEANKPEVSLVSSYALNGRNDSFSGAFSDFSQSNRPSYAVGIQFVTSLHFGAGAAAREGARLRQQATMKDLEHRSFDQEQAWRDLVEQFSDTKARLRLAQSIVKAQNEKLNEEKRLMRLGRSSLFNVLNFEQDYLRAEQARVQSAYAVLLLRAQSKFYVTRET